MSITTAPASALSTACPKCNAQPEELCKSTSGKPTRTPHRARVLAAGGTVPKLGRQSARATIKATTKAAPRKTRKQVIDKPGINSSTIGEFMDDLEKLRDKWALDEATMIAVRDNETDRVLAAAFDQGAWLVTMGN